MGLVDHKQMPICQGKMLLDHVAKEGRSYAGGQDTLLRKEDTYTGSQNDLLRMLQAGKESFPPGGSSSSPLPHSYPPLNTKSSENYLDLQRAALPRWNALEILFTSLGI